MKKIYGEIILVFLNFIITILTINVTVNQNFNYDASVYEDSKKLYLYGGLDGCGYEISNLNLNSEYKYLYLENYGTFKNITLKNCLIKAVFVYDNQYGTYENVTII